MSNKSTLAEKINENLAKEKNNDINVICLVYNHAPYIRHALDSILAQKTDYKYSIIIHDDASTDGSTDIVKEYANKYPDIIIPIIRDVNVYQQGLSIWPEIYEKCDAKYLAFCECDDYWIDDYKLQKQIDFLENNHDYSAVYANIVPIDKNGNYNEKLRYDYEKTEERDYTKYEIKNYLLKSQTASLVGVNYYKYMEQYKEAYTSILSNEDSKWFFVYTHLGKVRIMGDELAAHRKVVDEGDSWSSSFSKMSEFERSRIRFFHEMCRVKLNNIFLSKDIIKWDILLENYIIVKKEYKKSNSTECKVILEKMESMKKIPWYQFGLYYMRMIFKKVYIFFNKVCKKLKRIFVK